MMSHRYQVTFGDQESLLLEVIARERGIPIAVLIRESSLYGLSERYWEGWNVITLHSDDSRIETRRNLTDKIEWEIFEIPNIEKGYVSQPNVELRNHSSIPPWIISKCDPLGNFQEMLWDSDNDNMILHKVRTGDRIWIKLPSDIDPTDHQLFVTLRLAYCERRHGQLIR